VTQNLALEIAQRRAGLERQLVGEQSPPGAVDVQRLGLAARTVEGEHQLAAQMLAIGVHGHELAELAHQLVVPPQPKLCVDPPLERRQALLGQPGKLVPRRGPQREPGERAPAPESQGAAQPLRRELGIISTRQALADEPLEPCRVQALRIDTHEIAAGARHDRVTAEDPA